MKHCIDHHVDMNLTTKIQLYMFKDDNDRSLMHIETHRS